MLDSMALGPSALTPQVIGDNSPCRPLDGVREINRDALTFAVECTLDCYSVEAVLLTESGHAQVVGVQVDTQRSGAVGCGSVVHACTSGRRTRTCQVVRAERNG